MKKLENKGFSIIEGLLVLVVIGIVGGTIFYVRKANNNIGNGNDGTTISQNQNQKSDTAPIKPTEDPNKGYLVVKEWGVRIKFRDIDRIASYSYNSEPGDLFGEKFDSAISPVIKPYDPKNKDCKNIGLGMYRSKTPFSVETTKVNGYYFLVTGGPGQCAENTNDPDNTLQKRLIQDFSNYNNIEALP